MSKNRTIRNFALAAAALVVGALAMTGVAQVTKAKPTAIAVVDIQKVFNSLEEKLQIDADLRSKGEKLEKEGQGKIESIKSLEAELNKLVAPGTPAFAGKQEQYEREAIELQTWREFQQRKFAREGSVQLQNLYRKILDAVARAAQQGGYDLVLFKEPEPDFRNVKPEAVLSIIQARKVLWANEGMELTDQVTTMMNNEFKHKTAN